MSDEILEDMVEVVEEEEPESTVPQVRGRGRLEASVAVYCGEIVIHLDDASRPEFWAELRLTVGQLEELARLARERVPF